MGRLPVCFYGEEDPNEALKRFYEGIRALSEKGIDGFNISDQLLGDGLIFDEPTDPRVTPRKIVNELADTTSNCYIRCKTDGLDPATEYGLEAVVDPRSSGYGKFCILAKNDTQLRQTISLYPENPESSIYGGYIDFPAGTGRIRTTGNFNLILGRNSVVQLEFTSAAAELSTGFFHLSGPRKVPVTRTVMTGNVVLTTASNEYQAMDVNGANRNVDMPVAATGMTFVLQNVSGGAFGLTVRDNGGTNIVGPLGAGAWARTYYDGTAWNYTA